MEENWVDISKIIGQCKRLLRKMSINIKIYVIKFKWIDDTPIYLI